MTEQYPVTSAAGQEMATFQPPIYETSRVMRSYLQATGSEFDLVNQAINEVLNQFYVRTATWNLDKWEVELNLPPDPSLTDSERQDRIVSKLRGFGTCKISIIKSVAESYDKGTINVGEDFANYTIIVYFVDTTGVPSNVDDLKKALRDIVPAHLEIIYKYNYFIWDELDAKNWTWDQVDALGLTWDKWEVYG